MPERGGFDLLDGRPVFAIRGGSAIVTYRASVPASLGAGLAMGGTTGSAPRFPASSPARFPPALRRAPFLDAAFPLPRRAASRLTVSGSLAGITTATHGLALAYIIGVVIYVAASPPGTAG